MILEQSQRHGAKIDEAKKENLVQFFIPTSNELCFDDFVFPGVKCLKVYIDHTVILSARLEYHLADLRLHLAMMRRYGLKTNPLTCAFCVSAVLMVYIGSV